MRWMLTRRHMVMSYDGCATVSYGDITLRMPIRRRAMISDDGCSSAPCDDVIWRTRLGGVVQIHQRAVRRSHGFQRKPGHAHLSGSAECGLLQLALRHRPARQGRVMTPEDSRANTTPPHSSGAAERRSARPDCRAAVAPGLDSGARRTCLGELRAARAARAVRSARGKRRVRVGGPHRVIRLPLGDASSGDERVADRLRPRAHPQRTYREPIVGLSRAYRGPIQSLSRTYREPIEAWHEPVGLVERETGV